jgi:hypothetical protein
MKFIQKCLVVFLVSCIGLIASTSFACEAILELRATPGFFDRGVLGSRETYVQKVYSGNQMSYSTILFAQDISFNKKSLMQQTAKSMISTVSAANKTVKPQVQVLDPAFLPELDSRLGFLSYVIYGTKDSVNVEASASIGTGLCWSILRFSARQKQTKEEALNQFANLIRATKLIK